MQDMELFQKIMALRDLVKAINLKLKSPKNDIAMPEIKPVSMPNVSTSKAPSKIPGIAPASKKDPNKVAQQLKVGKKNKKPKLSMNPSDMP